MKSISKYLLFVLALFVFQNAFAQEEGDAVFKKLIQEYTLNEDGSTEYREYKEIKLLSHMSFHRLFGETFIIFDPEYQEIKINEAYTIMADGQKVVVPDNAFNEVLPRAAAHTAAFNRLRELVITHTGLEVGATIYLDYTLKTKAGYMPTFMGEEVIKDIVPIKEKQLVIRIPDGQELQYKMLNLRTSPEINQEKGMQVYTFTFRGLPAYSREWGNDYELLPRLFFSTAKDLERAYFPFVSQPAFTYQANAEMEAAAKKLKEEKEDELKTALAIQKMVVNEIGTWNLALEYTGFKCRTPEEVWKSNGGTPLEKTVLLATLLMKAGFGAVPVAIIPEKYYDRKVGSLYIFKDFAVQLKVGSDERIYLSATKISSQNLGISLSGKKFLILDGAIESLRTFESGTTPAEIIYHGNFINDENEKLTGNLNITLRGAVNPFFSLSLDTAYAKRYAGGTQNVKLFNLDLNESIFDLEIVKRDVFDEYGDYVFMELPVSSSGISSWGFTYIETGRQTPIKLPELIREQYHYIIQLPAGYELISSTVDITVNNAIGKLSISLRQEGNTVYSTREIELKKDLIQFNEFGAFNELWKAWMNPSMKEIVFRKAE
ncbi:MAG: DUF3857 domain-containing protein [Bacteroidales bacterium]|nr:DUF3857 domain-containing protein [Bacteroidales bacterium]